MQTSRISRDTTKVLSAIASRRNTTSSSPLYPLRSPPPSRAATSLADHGFAENNVHESDSELSEPPSDFEDADTNPNNTTDFMSPSRKRKRGTRSPLVGASRTSYTVVTTRTASPMTASFKIPTENGVASSGPPRKVRRQPAKKVAAENGEVKVEPPPNWEEVYNLTKQMRSRVLAPVDTMGCESLAEDFRSPREMRFQTLVALMLSSQTKDTVTAVAMKNLQQNLPGGLTLESILAVLPELLNELIIKVGFHNNKTRYIKAMAEILRDKYNSDIPDTIEGLTSLPGVGPKMAYLCMSAAWDRHEGIGVDVHVHRITNLWGWQTTNTPESTRAALEAWLPRDKWHEINHLLVGFGQTICLPVGRRCGECALADRGLCPSAVVGVKKTVRVRKGRVVREEPKTGETMVEENTSLAVEEAEIRAEDVNPEHLHVESTDCKVNLTDIEELVASKSLTPVMPSAEPLHRMSDTQSPSNPPNLSQKLPRLTPRKRPLNPQRKPSNPPLETPALASPPPREELHFSRPSRRILSPKDHEIFLSSPTYTLLVAFVFNLSDSVGDTPISALDRTSCTPTTDAILAILDSTEALLGLCPPEDSGGSRFGNRSFRSFLDLLSSSHYAWHKEKLGIQDQAAIEELSTYFLQSFGNRTRIDYGSGHELNFILWLLCLNRMSMLPPFTFPALVLQIFPRYLQLMRKVQNLYYLEPAGSHGVWGLDDYQFLPFLFGASQLLHDPFIRPLSIHQQLIIEEYGKDYLYLDQVGFVNSVKNVEGLQWHSPMLDDISSAKDWGKVEAGMKRMFIKEVLGKLPVMQHFLFGSLIPAEEGMSKEQTDGAEEGVVMEDGMRHEHIPNSWGDCCGIKVPSSVGAMQEMKKRMGGEGLRRVPFD